MKITEHFTLEEFIRSEYAIRNGIENTPNVDQTKNIIDLCQNILEPLRVSLNTPIQISSGFRCVELNEKIGGAPNSQHTEGKAADIIVKGILPIRIIKFIVELKLDFDQAIEEFGAWTHISYSKDSNRKNLLQAVKVNGKTEYKNLII